MPRKQTETTRIRRKITRGEDLTPGERTTITSYYARSARRKQGVHLKGDREERWRSLAAAEGKGLSGWIQEQVEIALRGPGEALREVREENQRLRDENTGLRGASGHLAVENSRLQTRIATLEENLMDAMDHALRLKGAFK